MIALNDNISVNDNTSKPPNANKYQVQYKRYHF